MGAHSTRADVADEDASVQLRRRQFRRRPDRPRTPPALPCKHARIRGRATIDPDDAEMHLTLNDRKFTEVDIERHEDSMLLMRSRENLWVARIFRPLGSSDYVVTGGSELLRNAMRKTAIEQQLHDRQRQPACPQHARRREGTR